MFEADQPGPANPRLPQPAPAEIRTVVLECNACGAALHLGLSQMGSGSAQRCAACGATLAAVEAEQPYTIEFASDQRNHLEGDSP